MNHCWHHTPFQHSMTNHRDVQCCWCGVGTCQNAVLVRDDSHGPHVEVMKVAYWRNNGALADCFRPEPV